MASTKWTIKRRRKRRKKGKEEQEEEAETKLERELEREVGNGHHHISLSIYLKFSRIQKNNFL